MGDSGIFTGKSDAEFLDLYESAQQAKASDTGISPLGSGSDFTPFLQHLGVSHTTSRVLFTIQ